MVKISTGKKKALIYSSAVLLFSFVYCLIRWFAYEVKNFGTPEVSMEATLLVSNFGYFLAYLIVIDFLVRIIFPISFLVFCNFRIYFTVKVVVKVPH